MISLMLDDIIATWAMKWRWLGLGLGANKSISFEMLPRQHSRGGNGLEWEQILASNTRQKKLQLSLQVHLHSTGHELLLGISRKWCTTLQHHGSTFGCREAVVFDFNFAILGESGPG
jgi:hypothetical protein